MLRDDSDRMAQTTGVGAHRQTGNGAADGLLLLFFVFFLEDRGGGHGIVIIEP